MAHTRKYSAHCLAPVGRFCFALGILLAAASLANAAPVTFRFEAEVASVSGVPLPFPVTIGDDISAKLTFETSAAGSPYVQSLGIEFSLSGSLLQLSEYRIRVADDDFPGPTDIRGRIADPLNTPIVDFRPIINDNVIISSNLDFLPSAGVLPGTVIGLPHLSFAPVVVLAFPDDVLTTNVLPDDIASWNDFTFREMSLSFVNALSGDRTYVGAYLRSFYSVPEPFYIHSGAISIVFMSAFRCRSPINFRRRTTIIRVAK